MKRILFDLTDLEAWAGQHGGIQRVVYGIAYELYMDKDCDFDVVWIVYDNELAGFRQASFEPIVQRVQGLAPLAEAEPELSRQAQGIVQKLAQKTPKAIKEQRHVRRLYEAVRPVAQDTHSEPEVVRITKQDIVMMAGKPWDNLNIQRYLSEEKKRADYTLVQVVYDMIISLQPHLQNPVLVEPYNEHMKMVVADSDLLLCISESTRQDVKRFAKLHQLNVPRAEVIRLGDEIQLSSKQKPQRPDNRLKEDQFIACVGTVEIRKNHTLLYYTYKLAAEQGIVLPPTAIVGGRGWLTGDIQYMIDNDPETKDKLFILDQVDDAGLRWIYENCLFTVYPSMYEGWGLPIAESLNYGKVCIASHTSSMTEIAGDLIPYCSPYDATGLLEQVRQLIMPSTREKYEKQIERYTSTSWNDTYQNIVRQLRGS